MFTAWGSAVFTVLVSALFTVLVSALFTALVSALFTALVSAWVSVCRTGRFSGCTMSTRGLAARQASSALKVEPSMFGTIRRDG